MTTQGWLDDADEARTIGALLRKIRFDRDLTLEAPPGGEVLAQPPGEVRGIDVARYLQRVEHAGAFELAV